MSTYVFVGLSIRFRRVIEDSRSNTHTHARVCTRVQSTNLLLVYIERECTPRLFNVIYGAATVARDVCRRHDTVDIFRNPLRPDGHGDEAARRVRVFIPNAVVAATSRSTTIRARRHAGEKKK